MNGRSMLVGFVLGVAATVGATLALELVVQRRVAERLEAESRRAREGAAREKPSGLTAGEFQIHYQQGFSLDRREIASPDAADVVFANCAGGVASVTLSAANGIASLGRLSDLPSETSTSTLMLFESVVAAEPSALKLRFESDADDRVPESNVFVVRTRSGGWAKLAVVNRGKNEPWTRTLVTFRYVLNPLEPRFEESAGASSTRELRRERGVVLDSAHRDKDSAEVLAR